MATRYWYVQSAVSSRYIIVSHVGKLPDRAILNLESKAMICISLLFGNWALGLTHSQLTVPASIANGYPYDTYLALKT